LTPQQIAFYNEWGYLKPFRVFDEDGAKANLAYFDGLLEGIRKLDDGRDAYSINGYHQKCQGLYEIVTNPDILDLVQDLIGPNFVCWGTHFFCKMPGDPKSVPWHQDASYWPFDISRTVTAWLAIDDVDVENGCMEVIPGTHRMGALKWENTKSAAVLHQEIVDAEQYGERVPFELKAGEMSLHADMLAHGSPPNLSNRRRGGLTMRYTPVEVRALNDDPIKQQGWNRQAIIVRGADPSGHWSNHPRPLGEDLSAMPWQINAG
jgi:ectoine hydroxylase-related dioxygenase (phytanoyl-CoA dioxygenase family)